MFKFKSVLIVLLLCLCVSVQLSAGGHNDASAEEEIQKSLAAYGQYIIDGEYELWGQLHSENVVKMPPNSPPTTNREDMVARSREGDKYAKVLEFNVDIQEMETNGNRAHAWGLYTVKIQPLAGGEPFMVDGKFLTLYRKEQDGRWVITHDCFNSNVPPGI